MKLFPTAITLFQWLVPTTFYGNQMFFSASQFFQWKVDIKLLLFSIPKLKLLPNVNFTNILWAAFCAKMCCVAFLYLQFVFVIFWQKEIGRKLLVKCW